MTTYRKRVNKPNRSEKNVKNQNNIRSLQHHMANVKGTMQSSHGGNKTIPLITRKAHNMDTKLNIGTSI